MKVLVLNAGSSSLKWGLFEVAAFETASSDSARQLVAGSVTRIGVTGTQFSVTWDDGSPPEVEARSMDGHDAAIDAVLQLLAAKGQHTNSFGNVAEIDVVGHRVVHGGERFSHPIVMTDDTVRELKRLNSLAPLHNPHNVRGIEAALKKLPRSVQVAVFDTAFHATLPPPAYLYAIPLSLYERHGVRRYGFHGISHQYVTGRAAELMRQPLEQLRLVSCHLGNGASVAAVQAGQSVDTSMGFTPIEGLVMGTRSGDIDPGALLHIMEREQLSIHDAAYLLNRNSGLYGVSGVSDMQDIEKKIDEGDRVAELAFELFAYRLRKYVGAYAAAMGGIDAILFTGGIGEHSPRLRAAVLRPLAFIGLELDASRNVSLQGESDVITHSNSKVEAWVIRTREELLIASQAASAAVRAPTPVPALS